MNAISFTEDNVEDYDGKLGSRIRKMVEQAKDEAEEGKLEFEIVIEEWCDGASVTVKPSTSMFTEGELGSDRYHVLLGPKGGVHHATRTSMFGDEVEFHKKKSSFKKIVSRMEHIS